MDTRILLLDDEPFMLRLLTRMLESLGASVVWPFDSSAEALASLQQPGHSADLILLDINMPRMDGVEFIRNLVALGYQGHLVLVSGEDARTLESVQRLAEAHGLKSVTTLQKPVQRDALAAVLEAARTAGKSHTAPRHSSAEPSVEELEVAIERSELINHYQPQVSLIDGTLTGIEALVRWQTPAGRLVYPDQFIPCAERHSLMPRVTQQVLLGALGAARSLETRGIKSSIAVNVSMGDLASLEFPDRVLDAARAIGVEPSRVTLEVTESQVMKNLSTVLDVLTRLRLKRFRLAIDDFGTGHSSLSQLRDLPFDGLKIDRGFVNGVARDKTLRAICSASIRMARQLQLHVVAEGVEQAEDWSVLQEMGCEEAQGYLIARPMPLSEMTDWVERWQSGHRSVLPSSA